MAAAPSSRASRDLGAGPTQVPAMSDAATYPARRRRLCHDPWLLRHLGHDQDALHTADSASPVGCGGASRGKHRSSAYALTWPPGQTRILNAPSLRSAARTGPWRDVLTSAQLLAGI